MNCSDLGYARSPLTLILIVASLCLATAALVVFAGQRRRGVIAVGAVLVVNALLAGGLAAGSTAHAAATCVSLAVSAVQNSP